MSEKLAKDNKVEELKETLAEGIDEEPVKEPVEEGAEEETAETETTEEEIAEAETTEEIAETEAAEAETAEVENVEDTQAEEAEETLVEEPADEMPTEEMPTEEATAEGPKKSKKILKISAIVAAVIIVVWAGIYVGISMRYSECFLMGTVVNGTDCSGMTVKEVETLLEKQIKEYVLTVEGANDYTEEIKGTDIGIACVKQNHIQDAFDKQNSYAWPKALFETNEVKADVDFEYDSAKLDERIAALACQNAENQVAAVAATVVYQDGEFIIQDETYGTQVDTAKLSEAIHACVAAAETRVNLEEAGCYVQPRFTKESTEVIAARDEMNKYLTANITYSLDGIVVTLDKSQTYQWISVDENMSPVISTDGVKSFAKTLSSKYNTADRGGQLTTPRGKVVDMPLGGYGRVVGVDSETKQLINEIKEGKTITREPIFSRNETPEGQNIWGSTYMEVDITEQHIWFIVNGQVALETDVITGKKGVHDTPTGVFTILEKIRNKTLRGRPGPDGKPSYLVPVDYWMRVTWSGIGFHDAGYRSVFGGNQYETLGSHGCINMPPAKAGELYNILPVGTPVVIHY